MRQIRRAWLPFVATVVASTMAGCSTILGIQDIPPFDGGSADGGGGYSDTGGGGGDSDTGVGPNGDSGDGGSAYDGGGDSDTGVGLNGDSGDGAASDASTACVFGQSSFGSCTFGP